MNEIPDTFPYKDIPKTIPDSVIKRPKSDAEMTYLDKNNIDEVIRQNLSKKDVYESDMHNI